MRPVCVAALALLTLLAPVAHAADAVVEAKRKAANDLIRSGRTADGLAMLDEVVRADPDDYRDHLTIARAHEKASASDKAVEAYRRVIDLTANATAADARTARLEAERRVKVLDQMAGKVDAVIDDIMKKLDAAEREARLAKNVDAMNRLLRVRAAAYRSMRNQPRWGCEVFANSDWQPTGYRVRKGVTYQVSALGTWRFSKGPGGETDADGSPTVQEQGQNVGMLQGTIAGTVFFKVGKDGTFQAAADGMLYVIMFKPSEKKREENCSGSIHLFIEPAASSPR